MQTSFSKYQSGNFFDEMFHENGEVRENYEKMYRYFEKFKLNEITDYQKKAEQLLLNWGVTFNDYSESEKIERIMPFDIIPRIIAQKEWDFIENGLKQRINVLNLFLEDIYGNQSILKDKIIPSQTVLSSKFFLKECIGIKPSKNIWIHISGIDLIKDVEGVYRILEDNLRCPSGVSYCLKNREITSAILPNLMIQNKIEKIEDYPTKLAEMLHFISKKKNHSAAILTPGEFNSAYFEHSYLAQQAGISLVEPQDLVVYNHRLKKRTIKGLENIDVLYRRIDDVNLDNRIFNRDSLLAIPGLFEVYKKGNVAIANAFGTGVADDKVIYAHTPKFFQYYLNQDPIIPIVDTYLFDNKQDYRYVLNNLEKLVVKEANEAGGNGMLIGSESTKVEQEIFRKKIKSNPRNFIAQPIIQLSRVPCLSGLEIKGKHVDLRPYIILGKEIFVTKGGLTRVAIKENSLVVNSSKGGGSKDTWVLSKND